MIIITKDSSDVSALKQEFVGDIGDISDIWQKNGMKHKSSQPFQHKL